MRFAAVINIQNGSAWKLFDGGPDNRGLHGTPAVPPPQRRTPSASRHERHGRWSLSNCSAGQSESTRVIAPQILTSTPGLTRVVGKQLGELSAQGRGHSVDGSQYLVLQCKVAAILAMWEARLHVTLGDDWEMAGLLLDASDRTLASLEWLRFDKTQSDERYKRLMLPSRRPAAWYASIRGQQTS